MRGAVVFHLCCGADSVIYDRYRKNEQPQAGASVTDWSLDYTIDIDTEHAVARVKIYGLWKKETAERYHRDFAKAVQPLLGRPWAKVIDLTKWKTSYEIVIEVIGRHMEWSRENDVRLQLYILDNPSTFRQLNRMFEKGDVKAISSTFRKQEEAERYLKENWIEKQS